MTRSCLAQVVCRCLPIVVFGTWCGDAGAIAELARHSNSSLLWAGTETLGKLEPEIFVDYAEYLVSLSPPR